MKILHNREAIKKDYSHFQERDARLGSDILFHKKNQVTNILQTKLACRSAAQVALITAMMMMMMMMMMNTDKAN